MLGVHVNATAPVAGLGPRNLYSMNPLEVLTSIAATLFWRRMGHDITLYTDASGLRFYEETGFAEAYNHLDISCLEEFQRKTNLDPVRTPCVGRMQVLGSIQLPFVAMDLDFVPFNIGTFPFSASDLCCFHWELPNPPWYPPREEQLIPDGFVMPSDLDFLTLVPNIAFLYVGKVDFFRDYAALAVDYVKQAVEQNTDVASNKLAIFADQRLLGMLAHKQALSMETLRNDIWTCGSVGDRWEVLAEKHGLGTLAAPNDLVSPFWVLDRHRFDERKETVECAHLWFEKSRYSDRDRHFPRRFATVEAVIQRVEREFSHNAIADRLLHWLRTRGLRWNTL